jgi:hypothetical protein
MILCTNLNDFVRKFVWDFVRNHYVWFVHKFYMGVLRGLSGANANVRSFLSELNFQIL